mgnify:CR=1 FL=1
MNEDVVRTFLTYAGTAMFISLLLGLLLLGWVAWQVKRIDVPEGADFAETLRYTPLTVVIMIDLLDFALDFLGAPVAWVILDRLGLKALRGVATVEAFVPFTQLIPTMTLAWIGVRVLKIDPSQQRVV